MEHIPVTGLGTWKSTEEASLINAIKYSVEEAGYRHIDCAKCYGNEKSVGKALHDILSRGVVKREELWVTSKLWCTDHHPDHVEAACRQTLADLQLDYLDLYLIHHPTAFVREGNEMFPKEADGTAKIDRSISLIDTWRAMEHLVEIGLVKHIGVSNFTINMLERIRFAEGVKIQPYTNQCELHLYLQQEPLIHYMNQRGIIFTAYSPLGTNDWRQPDEPCVLEDPVLCEIAKELGCTPADVELEFLRRIAPGVSLLVKSVTPARILQNIKPGPALTDAHVAKLKSRERCYRFVDATKMWKVDQLGDGW